MTEPLIGLLRMPMMVISALVMSFVGFAEEVVPPIDVPIVNITARLGSNSNAVHATLASGYGYWCKGIISKYKRCTFWTSEISSSNGVAAIEMFERNTLTGEAKKTDRFVASIDEDGNYRFTMASSSWTDSDPSSLEFYLHIRGTANTSITLNFQLAEVSQVFIGTRERPFRFDFLETKLTPREWHDTISRPIRDNGYYYMVSDLVAGDRYYFGVATNVPDATLFSLISPNGDEVILSTIDKYSPWDAYETNIYDIVTCLTNSEERITVSQKYTVVSNENLSVTNVYTITGVYTNATEGAVSVLSNFVAVVTNVDMSIVGVVTTVEVVTNYEMCVLSIQTNIVKETNIAHIGICRDARRFVPQISGEYLFVFKGSGSFTMYDARKAALPIGDDLEFSSPSGTFIPPNKPLKLKLQCLKELPYTNIYYTVDGSDPRYEGNIYSAALKIEKPTVVRACLELDDGDKGNVYASYYYPARGEISEAIGVTVFNGALSDSPSHWFEDLEKTDDGARTIRNIPLENDGEVNLSLRIAKDGEFSFLWRCSSEELWDEAIFCTNGVVVARISGETKWDEGLVSVSVSKDTVLTWIYSKDEETSDGNDCVWLADFRFRPDNVLVNGVGGVVKVPMGWFAQYGLDDVGMAMEYPDSMSGETIAKTDALPRSLYESYVAGLDPTNSFERFEVNISVVEGKPFLTWSPDLGNERVYTIWGSADLAVDSWHSPTNAYDRFFKVKVEMP